MTNRSIKVAKELQHAMGEILLDDYNFNFKGVLLTVSEVTVTNDIREATIFCSLFGSDEKMKKEFLETLKKDVKKIRMKLAHKIVLKYFPKIFIKEDKTLDNVENINKILRDIR